jgi:tetratricopeptide (TPR) repeat protein
MTLVAPLPVARPSAAAPQRPAELLASGLDHDQRGNLAAATDCYAAAIDGATQDPAILSEALRRLAVLHNRRAETGAACDLGRRAMTVATDAGLPVLAAEALNALGGFAFESGDLASAREHYESALELGAGDAALVLKVEQNIGLLHGVRGEWPEAAALYRRSASAAERCNDTRSAAYAYHNLGLLAADERHWEEAFRQFRRALGIALREGDTFLEALCLLNQADVHLALDRYDEAREDAERALRIFDRLESRRDKSAANRVLGMVFRETRRPALAESRLRSAVEIAVSTNCPLSEAEAHRELAELYRRQGRGTDALAELDVAADLFSRLGARVDVADVERRIARVWGA